MTERSRSFYDGDGVFATPYTGTATGTATYPADFNGGVTTTASASVLHNAKIVQVLGIRITAATGLSTMSFVDSAGNALNFTGAVFIATTATGMFQLGGWEDGIRYAHSTNANLGFSCTNSNVRFIMFWRKLA